MFSKLRLFLCLFFLSALSAAAQSDTLEILVLGTSHQNTPGDYSKIIGKLKALQPDMVFGEYLSPADLKALPPDSYNAVGFKPKHDFIAQRSKPVKPAMLPRKIKQTEEALARFQFLHQARMTLAQHHVLNFDRGNAEYQLWVLQNKMASKFGEGERNVFEKAFLSVDTLIALKLIRPKTEYHQIIFPLVYELGMPRIYPMDCQKYDDVWSEAWYKAKVAIEAMEATAKQDSTSPAALVVKTRDRFYAEMGQKIKESKMTSYQINNSETYAQMDAAYNFYGGSILYDLPGFPTQAIKDMYHFWQLRNEGMCQNLVSLARAHKAKRVIVAVGASHRKIMNDILATYPTVKLLYYNDLPEPTSLTSMQTK
ncbi:DUF5694 domain-containing protein [Rufibacter latericius]|uniref:TraB/GumN family protein n=1 Tax=Rufibacter latericius TaxID=2487040 RepID=A0A3M9MCX5_9BACT|nr:DUF5694 domain-containing protein [Rufibacter latericius]RNI23396.1 hypothetical protein EFB08_17780 [Rufibacter latericius]